MRNEILFFKNVVMYWDEKVFVEGKDLGVMIKMVECWVD